MSYYNNVFILFGRGGEHPQEYRTGCQALPGGAVPLCIINGNTKVYTEIINSVSPQKAFEWLENEIDSDDIPESMKKDMKNDLKGEYQIILSTYPGWDFNKGDSLVVKYE